jgi:hypothetical protein
LELLLDRRRDGALISGLKLHKLPTLADEVRDGLGLIGGRHREVEMRVKEASERQTVEARGKIDDGLAV